MVSSKPKSKAIFRFIYEGFLNCTLEELYSLEDWPVYFYHSSRARKPEDKTIFHQNLRTDFAKFLSGFKMSQASFMARAENSNEEEFNQILVDQISLISDEDVLVLAKSEFIKSPAMCTLPKEFFQEFARRIIEIYPQGRNTTELIDVWWPILFGKGDTWDVPIDSLDGKTLKTVLYEEVYEMDPKVFFAGENFYEQYAFYTPQYGEGGEYVLFRVLEIYTELTSDELLEMDPLGYKTFSLAPLAGTLPDDPFALKGHDHLSRVLACTDWFDSKAELPYLVPDKFHPGRNPYWLKSIADEVVNNLILTLETGTVDTQWKVNKVCQAIERMGYANCEHATLIRLQEYFLKQFRDPNSHITCPASVLRNLQELYGEHEGLVSELSFEAVRSLTEGELPDQEMYELIQWMEYSSKLHVGIMARIELERKISEMCKDSDAVFDSMAFDPMQSREIAALKARYVLRHLAKSEEGYVRLSSENIIDDQIAPEVFRRMTGIEAQSLLADANNISDDQMTL